MTDKRYDYWLNRLPGIGVQKRSILLADGRSAKDIFEMREEELLEIPFLMKQDVKRIMADRNTYDLKLSYEKLKSAGVDFITKEEKIFPARLGNIEGAPDALYVKGRLPVENVLSVAIVGARCCSEYGRAFAGEIAEALAAEGVIILSGMARGVDSAGHAGALRAGGATYAVLGCGVAVCYPPENAGLYEEIQNAGGLISEYAPGTPPFGAFFPARNRILSGMSDIVVVIEARERSGSLITADFAMEQGKDVYALPGRVTDRLSGGCNRLIKQGAGLVLSVEDFLKDLQIEAKSRRKVENFKKNLLEKPEMVVYSGLDFEPRSLDEIMKRTGMMLSEVSGALIGLQQKGKIKEVFKNYYVRS